MGEGKKGIMRQFDHEKLNVYQSSIQFAAWAAEI